MDGFSSVASQYLKFPPTYKLIKPFSVSTAVQSSNMPNHINRQWTITGTAEETGAEKSMTFYWTAENDNSYNWSANGATPVVYFGDTPYEPNSGAYNLTSDPRWVTISYTFASATKEAAKETVKIGRADGQTLPVQLSSFTALVHQGRSIKLMWQTQSETNVQGFSFYRGRTDILEDALYLNVNISGTNSSQPKSYIYYDREIFEPGLYCYWLLSTDFDGTSQIFGPINVHFDGSDGSAVHVAPIPGFRDAYPNPFNPQTTIRYGMDKAGKVEIKIYNQRGQLVRNLLQREHNEGWHQVIWDGRDDSGRNLTSGVYFARLNVSGKSYERKLVMMK